MQIVKSELMDILSTNDRVKVVFTKVDESIRTMICTRMTREVTGYEPSKTNPRTTPDDRVKVWDLESDGFRTIILTKIISVEVMESLHSD